MIVSDRTSVMATSSLHVPVTVMVLGPFWGSAASAALMLKYVPPLPPGQPTVTSDACAAAGSRMHVSKIAKTEALNRRFFLTVMLLFFKIFHRSLSWKFARASRICLRHTTRHLETPQAPSTDKT